MNIDNFARQVGLLQANVANVTQWYWPVVDKQTFGIILHDWQNGIKPLLQEHFAEPGGTIIQAGGNCGLYPLLYSAYFSHVYTFEPDPLSFFCLNLNCQIPSITKFNCALGQGPGAVQMKEMLAENRGMNRVENIDKPGIPTVAIDSFGFRDVRLMQLDLEGYEPPALRGAVETINKYHPMIILECADNYDDVFDVIRPLGYKPLAKITRLDTVFTYQP